MQSGFDTLLLLIVLTLMHWKFVSLYFSHKGGLKWFWRMPTPSGPLRLARLSFIALLAAGAIVLWTASLPVFLITGVLIFGHLGLLVYLSGHPR